MIISCHVHDLGAFERLAVRKDVVGVLAGIGDPDVDVDDKVDMGEYLVDPSTAVRAVVDRVARGNHERFDGVGASCLHLIIEIALSDDLALEIRGPLGEHDGHVVEHKWPTTRCYL